MDAFIPLLTRVHYSIYSNHPNRFEPMFKLFLAIQDGDYTMAVVQPKPVFQLQPFTLGENKSALIRISDRQRSISVLPIVPYLMMPKI
jgi:hypothetical protein